MQLENYQLDYQKQAQRLKQLQEKSNRYTFLRTITLVIFLLFVYINITKLTIPYFSMLVFCIGIFMILVYQHGKVKKQLNYHTNKAMILKQYIDRFDRGWIEFLETGESYKKVENFIDKDLDLLGKHSLFQFINVAKTSLGKQKLVDSLVHPKYPINELLERQSAVKEIADDYVLSLELQTLLVDTNKKDDISAIKEFLDKLLNIKTQRYAWLFRFITWIIMILAILQVFNQASWSVLMLAVLINLLISNIGGLRYHQHFTLVHSISKSLNRYQNIFDLLSKHQFKSPYLKEMLTDIQSNQAAKGLRSIYKISEMISQRQNVIGNFVLNGLFIYDLLCIDSLAKWQKTYHQEILSWFNAFGELEVILSLAIIPQVKEKYCYPEFTSKNMSLDFKAIAHPLMEEKLAVANDFNLIHQANIITGSNMSGKTTFLRTIGVNLVLAYAGGAICSQEAKISHMMILTSMRIEDELSSGTSTFYAELKRIKRMIDESDKGVKVCCFIDEIFKGTNSADRIVGAKAAIERMIRDNVIVFVSTHDFELCDLEKTLPISNYHFKEEYINKEITFDYLIRNGRCHTTNARYLLEMVGIIQ